MSLTSSQLVNKTKQEIKEIAPDEVHRALQEGQRIHLVDIREREEVMDGYIPNAALIPRGFLELDVEEEVSMDRDAPIVLYCQGGTRSALGARDLAFMGYTNVSSMIGGFKSWKDAGFEIEQNGLLSEDDLRRYARHILSLIHI